MDNSDFDNTSLVHFSILIAVFALGFFGLSRSELFSRFKMLFIWLMVILLLVAGHSYWDDIKNSKFYASLVPGSAIINKNGEMEFIKAEDGHFFIDANVNGKNIRFMVDTGASDIVFSQKDAEKLGFDLNALEYNKIFSTANGMTRGASVKIGYLTVGEGEGAIELNDFYVSVNQGELDNSLLGMAFLDKLSGYRVEGNRLILRR